MESLVERDFDVRLHIAAAGAPVLIEEVVDSHPTAAGPPPRLRSRVAEDGAKELGKVPEVSEVIAAILHSEPAPRTTGRSLGVSLPVWSERVVAATLLRVGQDFVRFADLLEALGGVLGLCDVGVMFSRESSIRELDRLVVGLPVDSENPVVVLEIYCHRRSLHGSIADNLSLAR